jgi:hypothetical protein
MKLANFLFFWMLVTWSINRGDLIGIALCTMGFLVMHTIIEEYHEAD